MQPASKRPAEQCRLIKPASTSPRRKQRHRRDQVKFHIRIFRLHTGQQQPREIPDNPQSPAIFQITHRLPDNPFIPHRRAGAVKSRGFAGTRKAAVIVLDIPSHRIAANSTKRRINFGSIRKTIPADERHCLG